MDTAGFPATRRLAVAHRARLSLPRSAPPVSGAASYDAVERSTPYRTARNQVRRGIVVATVMAVTSGSVSISRRLRPACALRHRQPVPSKHAPIGSDDFSISYCGRPRSAPALYHRHAGAQYGSDDFIGTFCGMGDKFWGIEFAPWISSGQPARSAQRHA